MAALATDNIECRPIWKTMHLQPVFADRDFKTQREDGTSVGGEIFERRLCLPSDIKMAEQDLSRATGIIKGLWK